MKIDYKKELNQQQYDAVTTIDGPVLIIAGAGSGKTRVLTYKVAYLIEHGVLPERILLLTFTNKAANEMKERAGNMLDERCKRITACTYHSFCAKLLRKYSRTIGYEPNYTIIDSGDAKDIISMIKAEHEYQKDKTFPKSSVIIDIISKSINKNCKIKDILFDEYNDYIVHLQKILIIKKEFRQYKRDNNMMDYDDLLYYIFYLLNKYPKIRKQVSDSYKYIMVDEYQDSNYLQEQIVFLLRQENRNLTVVGDDSQCIYGFRGSDVHNIIEFPNRMKGCKQIFLTNNYRSNQEIMDLSNNIMKEHATEGFYKEMKATHYKMRKPQKIITNSDREEAEFICRKIQELNRQGIDYKDICVLVRSSRQSYYLENLLNKSHIHYEKYGGLKFFDKKIIKDIIAYLRCSINNRDEIAWYRILQLLEGVGKTYARRIAQDCKENGIETLCDKKYKKRKFYNGLNELYNIMISLNPFEPEEELKKVVEYYFSLMKANIQSMNTTDEKMAELIKELTKGQEDINTLEMLLNGSESIITFLDDISLDNKNEDKEKSDKLVISTIHSAKGLEYNTVFIMDCIDGVFPSTTESDQGNKEDNEELRCFYVAVTRAKENLFLMIPEFMSLVKNPGFYPESHYFNGIDNYTHTISQ